VPTSVDFGLAADKFSAAASQVGDLTASVAGMDPGSVLMGGRVGAEVPTKIGQASSAAVRCQAILSAAAATCRLRATLMAAYEEALRVFNLQIAQYEGAWRTYDQQISQHVVDSEMPEPLRPMMQAPIHPTKPAWSTATRFQ